MSLVQYSNKRNTKVLLVESDTPLAMYFVFLLGQANCDVQVATNWERGLEFACDQEFDVILLDFDSTRLDGFGLCRELKQRHIARRTPIIFLLQTLNINDVRWSEDLGAVDCIAKPIDPETFAARVISRAAAKSQPLDELHDPGTVANAVSLAG